MPRGSTPVLQAVSNIVRRTPKARAGCSSTPYVNSRTITALNHTDLAQFLPRIITEPDWAAPSGLWEASTTPVQKLAGAKCGLQPRPNGLDHALSWWAADGHQPDEAAEGKQDRRGRRRRQQAGGGGDLSSTRPARLSGRAPSAGEPPAVGPDQRAIAGRRRWRVVEPCSNGHQVRLERRRRMTSNRFWGGGSQLPSQKSLSDSSAGRGAVLRDKSLHSVLRSDNGPRRTSGQVVTHPPT